MKQPAKGLLAAMFAQQVQADMSAESYYLRLKQSGKLKLALVNEQRCSKGCLLLHVFRTPSGLAFYMPKYDLSPELNAKSSSESGRKANTEDGNRKWKARSGLLSSALNLGLNCDHIRLKVLDLDALEIAEPGTVKRSIVSRD